MPKIHEFDNVEGFNLEAAKISCKLNSLLEATSVMNQNKLQQKHYYFYMYDTYT